MFTQQSARRDAYATPDDIEAGRVTGVGYAVSVESGQPIPVYVNDTPPPPPPQAAQPPVVQQVVVQRRELDRVTTRLAAASVGLCGVTALAGHYAHGLTGLCHAAEGAAGVVAAAAVAVTVLKGSAPKVTVNITNSNTGSSSSASSSSAAGWNATAGRR